MGRLTCYCRYTSYQAGNERHTLRSSSTYFVTQFVHLLSPSFDLCFAGSSGLLGGALDYQDYGSGGGLGDGGAFQASLPLVSTPVGGGAFG